MIPKFLLGADDDYWESFRRTVYPRIHPILQMLPFPAYSKGPVHENQYVCTAEVNQNNLEAELREAGFFRNPIAAYKNHPDGRKSVGSWRLLPACDKTGMVEDDMQLHVTLFESEYEDHVDIYAHYEKNWEKDATGHLKESGFSAAEGVRIASAVIESYTFFRTYQK